MLPAAPPHIAESLRARAPPLPQLLPPLSDDDTKTKDVVLNFENIKNRPSSKISSDLAFQTN